ncbi:MOSC domain-containing protein [Nocardioides sp. SYSU DS0663]|uniref:MOSC domain-containing protein n=1 Tax=Nocardioides sp. SYSU DS0663 TaxID=3416445 RepID=UPI003F4C79E7
MRVVSLHRYPVKSMAGETVDRVLVDRRGIVGDRAWAVVDPDGKLGSGKSTRRFRRMEGLERLAARYDGDPAPDTGPVAGPIVTLPDGRSWPAGDPALDAAVTAHVGRPVRVAAESAVPHHDEGPLHLVTTATLARLGAEAALLRANVVLDAPGLAAFAEDGWTGRELLLGGVLVRVREPMARCVMVGRRVLHEVAEVNDGCAGLVLDVVDGGTVWLGDEVRPMSVGATG